MRNCIQIIQVAVFFLCLFGFMTCKQKAELVPGGGVGPSLAPLAVEGKIVVPSSLKDSWSNVVVSSFAGTVKVNNDRSFSIELPQSQKLGVIYLNDQTTGNLLLMAYVKAGDKQVELNSLSTAIALLMMNPIFADLGDTFKPEAIDYLRKHPEINKLAQEVEKVNAQKQDLFSESNTALFRTAKNISVFFSNLRSQSNNDSTKPTAEPIKRISLHVANQHSIVVRNEGSWASYVIALYDASDNFLESYVLPGVKVKSNAFKGIGHAAPNVASDPLYSCLSSINYNSSSAPLCTSGEGALFTMSIPSEVSIPMTGHSMVKVRITNGIYGDDNIEKTYLNPYIPKYTNITKEDNIAFGQNFFNLYEHSLGLMGVSLYSDLTTFLSCNSSFSLLNLPSRYEKAGSTYYKNNPNVPSRISQNLSFVLSEGSKVLLDVVNNSSGDCSANKGAKQVLLNIIKATNILKLLSEVDDSGAGPNFMRVNHDLFDPFYALEPGFSVTATLKNNNIVLGGNPPNISGVWEGEITDKNGQVEAINFELISVNAYRNRPNRNTTVGCLFCVNGGRGIWESDSYANNLGEVFTIFVGGYTPVARDKCGGASCLLNNKYPETTIYMSVRDNGEMSGSNFPNQSIDFAGNYDIATDRIRLKSRTGKSFLLKRRR